MSGHTSNSRWWEFYAVRYGIGSIFGGIIFYAICSIDPFLSPLVDGITPKTLSGPQLTLLFGYGAAYCYISSAPILVFHITRFLLAPFKEGIRARMLVLASVPPVLVGLITALCLSTESWVESFFFFLAGCSWSFTLWLQALLIGGTIKGRNNWYSFYKNLAEKRESNSEGIINSYRHIREHGNAFFIVLFELVFALFLVTFANQEFLLNDPQPSNRALKAPGYILAVIIWTFPAVLAWLLGTLLERLFSEDKGT
ncbi:hypothetical protein [Vreelandella utahensis]|uniref:hypothetical protein n=1 Tax=Vreelandella halophila TaxID=86177 RepID=UPI00117BB0CD|nr:hypothetical protein [Halomonas utahensis]